MEQFFENIVLYAVIAAMTVPCWLSVGSNLSNSSRHWKIVLFRTGAAVGTLWLIIESFKYAPIVGAILFLFVIFLIEMILLYIIQWLFALSDEQIDKFLIWFFE